MITLKNIRENQDLISKKLKTKNFEVNKIEKLLNKDSDWREGLVLVEKLKDEDLKYQDTSISLWQINNFVMKIICYC